jgi:hypothetical protein
MKILLHSLLVVCLAAAAHADLTITQKVESEAQPDAGMTMTMKIKGKKVRMDVNPKVSTIMDVQSGDVQTLMHEQKVVMAISGDMVKNMRQAQQDAMGDPSKAEVPKPTGKKETITGFECEEYEATVNGIKMQMWLTQNLPAAQKVMDELASLSPNTDPFKGLLKENKISGFPMKSVIETPDGKKTSITVVALSEAPLPESEFVVPSGYKAMQMPAMPGQ